MSDFEAKKIRYASKYLQNKLDFLKEKEKQTLKLKKKQESFIKRLIKSFFA